MAADDSLQDIIRALGAMFSEKLPARLEELETVLQRCLDEQENRPHVLDLHRLLHTFAGTAGTFGFVELGLQARTLERQVESLIASCPDSHLGVEALAAAARALIAMAIPPAPA